jgi:hypothetical protein
MNRKRNKTTARTKNDEDDEDDSINAERVQFDVDPEADDDINYSKSDSSYLNRPQSILILLFYYFTILTKI